MAGLNLYAIGARIAYCRKRDGLRQYALAQQTGLHPVTISRIEHGQLPGLTLAVLWRIAAVLKVPVAYLWEEGYDIPALRHSAHHPMRREHLTPAPEKAL